MSAVKCIAAECIDALISLLASFNKILFKVFIHTSFVNMGSAFSGDRPRTLSSSRSLNCSGKGNEFLDIKNLLKLDLAYVSAKECRN